MLRHVAAFEWRYQLKSPVLWVGWVLFFLFAFGATTSDQIQVGSRGNVNVNAPYAILQKQSVLSVMLIFVVVAMISGVILRDDETGFAPIVRSTSVSKRSYLVGRFAGATLAAFFVLASVPLGIAIGAVMPWLDPEKVGSVGATTYIYALFAFGLPTLLICAASFFALATMTRSMMWTYVGAVAGLVLFLVTRGLLRDPRYDTISALTDPFGLSTLELVTKYWTASDRNTRMPALTGVLLWNRLLWTAVAGILFAITYKLFRFETHASGSKRVETKVADTEKAPDKAPGKTFSVDTRPASGWAAAWSLTRFDMAFVFRSPAFFVLLIIGLLNSIGSLWFAGTWYGSPSYPVTRLMVQALNGAYTIIPIIISIYYAGELVWRDRDSRVHEIVDATPAPDWAHLVPKIIAIALVLLCTTLIGVCGAMVVQTLKGYTHYEFGSFLLWFVWPNAIVAIQLAVLSVFAQVLVPQKYLGWGVMLVYLVASLVLASAGFEHNLYNYGGSPPVPLSDMNGMGRFWRGQAWFQVYWSAFAGLLVLVSYVLWRRGAIVELRQRLRQARYRLHGFALVLGVLLLATFVGSGVYIFRNTNRLNVYRTAPERDELQANAEKKLLPFEKIPQPKIVAVSLNVELFPREARAMTRGHYEIQNRTEAPIDVLHVRWNDPTHLDKLDLEGGSKIQEEWPQFRYRIYTLDKPMAPGEKRKLEFATTLEEKGFPNGAPFTRIVENGTFLNNEEIAPVIGMSRDILLVDRAKRRKYGLPPDVRPAKLEDDSARAFNALRVDSEWVNAEITVTSDADQTIIAPGTLKGEVVEGNRKTARFQPETPINHFFSIQSARYAVQKSSVRNIDLAVYYHPGHEYNVERMLNAMKVSLDLFEEKFSPYQFHQARILEFPSYADFAQSFANTIPYSENIGFLHHHDDPEKIDVVTYVTAHEIGHQWWGHQVVSANQQGASMLIESFAQYSALLVMEKMYGRNSMRRFLKYELDRYLRSRGSEVLEELPLARVENQPYSHYQKGSLVMYGLKEAVGEDVVNRSLHKLIDKFGLKSAPYPNPRDFLAILRAEAGPQHETLIADLFEKITLYDVKASHAVATLRSDGKYDVSFEVDAKKLYADGTGKETEAPLDEPFDVGVFSAEPGKKDFSAKSVLLWERRNLHTGKQTIAVTVDQAPTFVGADPYNVRIDRNSDDNLTAVDKPSR